MADKKYIALFKQAGEGCDYTIACGWKWSWLKAENLFSAIDESKEIIRELGDGEDILQEMTVLEFSNSIDIDIDDVLQKARNEETLKKEAAEEEAERAEFARLKEKYER
ncbi:MAG: hypothetical protein GF334_08485 [Candidatus Altiarchaeales archaeon]|nr:hypothetical protein [Candidatus Altiarchaeales archaeon]